jgi:hypothetical protein
MTEYSRVTVRLTYQCDRTIGIPVPSNAEPAEIHAAAFDKVFHLTPEALELEFADLDVVDGPHELVLAKEVDLPS